MMRDRIDQALSAAFRNVPVPEGLAPRLLVHLSEQGGSPIFDDAKIGVVPVRRSSLLLPSVSRRAILVGGGLLAMAAGLLVAAWLGANRSESLTEPFVLDEAIQLFNLGAEQPGSLLAENTAPPDYPFSLAVLPVRGTTWRTFDGFFGRRGVVYNLPGLARTSAALYVVDARDVEGFDAIPTLVPLTTAGCCAASWQEGKLLYILVVQGDPAMYRAYLSRPQGPVA